MKTETALETVRRVLRDHTPALSARLQDQVRRTFARLVKEHGPGLDGVANSWRNARVFRGQVARFVVYERGTGAEAHLVNKVARLDENRLRLRCDMDAAGIVDRWADKIAEKIGDLDSVESATFDGARYTIKGRRAGREVVIDQDMIVNVSARGTLFNQFPARIYVDGKFYAAAKYKTLFGETIDPASEPVRAAVC